MDFKEKLLLHYRQQVQDKIDAFRDMIDALSEDSRNDAKGSAGDKHETALSMMHLEQEKISRKLAEYLGQQAVLDKIDPQRRSDKVALGSLVTANSTRLFVSAALPKAVIDGVTVMALSAASPLGNKIVGQAIGYAFEISGTSYTINDIV
jgi:transcription elongation GreA/GreB family factor